MKTLIVKGTVRAIAIASFAWFASTAGAAEPAARGPYIKNLMSPSYRAPASSLATQWELTKSDIKRLTRTAETREDHLKIAGFWQAEAEKLEAQAARYENSAATFRSRPIAKNLATPNTAARWEFFARGLRNEARSDRALAASHEQTAKEV